VDSLVSFKSNAELITRIDTYGELFSARLGHPGIVSRSQAIRMLLELGLKQAGIGVPPKKRAKSRKKAKKR
jgi:hypothetical protein